MIGIKEMFMPECCTDCPFYSGAANGTCLAEHDRYESHEMYSVYVDRQDWCPLIEFDLTATIKN